MVLLSRDKFLPSAFPAIKTPTLPQSLPMKGGKIQIFQRTLGKASVGVPLPPADRRVKGRHQVILSSFAYILFRRSSFSYAGL